MRSVVSLCAPLLLAVVACSADDASAPPGGMQLGNGAPANAGGQGGSFAAGAGGSPGTAGAAGAFGFGGMAGGPFGVAGAPAAGGAGNGTGGMFVAGGGFGGAVGAGGSLGAGGFSPSGSGGVSAGGASSGGASAGGTQGATGETGRMVGMTAAHNAVRAEVDTQPPLVPVVWSQTIADYAQAWADSLAATSCNSPRHRSGAELQQVGYGENLAVFGSSSGGTTAQQAVDGWGGEVACYTLGTIRGTEQCNASCYMAMNSDGCGHYTQIVWRKTTEIGCGVATCQQGFIQRDIWICNYSPAGNYVGQAPY